MLYEWPVGKNRKFCSMCRVPFEGNRSLFSTLSKGNGEFSRTDYCASCWEDIKGRSFFSFWKTRLRSAKEPSKIDLDAVLDLFRELHNAEAEDQKALRFVLGLFLWRRKALKLIRIERETDREIFLFQDAHSAKPVPVENPNLTEAQIDGATDQIKELLQADA